MFLIVRSGRKKMCPIWSWIAFLMHLHLMLKKLTMLLESNQGFSYFSPRYLGGRGSPCTKLMYLLEKYSPHLFNFPYTMHLSLHQVVAYRCLLSLWQEYCLHFIFLLWKTFRLCYTTCEFIFRHRFRTRTLLYLLVHGKFQFSYGQLCRSASLRLNSEIHIPLQISGNIFDEDPIKHFLRQQEFKRHNNSQHEYSDPTNVIVHVRPYQLFL